jgi:hypothetical protein
MLTPRPVFAAGKPHERALHSSAGARRTPSTRIKPPAGPDVIMRAELRRELYASESRAVLSTFLTVTGRLHPPRGSAAATASLTTLRPPRRG